MDDLDRWITTLIANKDQSDVELHVEVVQERHTFVIPAHSVVLRHVSRVFDTMLDPLKFKEGATGRAEIKVHGSKANAVSFIKYLYTKKLQTLDTNAYVALMQTAHLYEMAKLIQVCEKRIRACLTPFSICDIYSVLCNMSSEAFGDFCKSMMLKFAFLIFGEKLHIALPEETMIFLLSSDKLNILDESQVLRAAWDWGHSKCILENTGATKEPKEIITSLIPLVKWSDINDSDTGSPWFDLCTSYKQISPASGQTVERKVDKSVSLTAFANVLNVYQNLDQSKTTSDYSDSNTLITFTCGHTVLLTGFEISVALDTQDTGKLPFCIFVDELRVENMSFIVSLPITVQKSGNSRYHYIFTLDFCKPILLRTNMIHGIYFYKTTCCFTDPTFKLYYARPVPIILGSDEEVQFSLGSQIAGITKLFYFIQS